MAIDHNDRLKVQITSTRDNVNADAFLEVFQNTLALLKSINRQQSEFGSEDVEWEIADAGLNSPIFADITGVEKTSRNGSSASEVIGALLQGMQHLETNNTCPKFFGEESLTYATNLVHAFARGVTDIRYSAGTLESHATHSMSQNANHAIQTLEQRRAKKSGQYIEVGTIEGRLRGATEFKRRDKIDIVDALTGDTTPCYCEGERLDALVRKAWKHRVSVSGKITVDRYTGKPTKMIVEDIRILGEGDLPKMEDLHGIDITHGVESSDYVRDLRNAEEA